MRVSSGSLRSLSWSNPTLIDALTASLRTSRRATGTAAAEIAVPNPG